MKANNCALSAKTISQANGAIIEASINHDNGVWYAVQAASACHLDIDVV